MSTKIFTGEIVKTDQRKISFIASHEKLDRHSELVLIDGIDTANYSKNPVMSTQHVTNRTAVARVTRLTKTVVDGAKALVGEAVFPELPASDQALAEIRAGVLNAISIEAKILETSEPVLPGQRGRTITKCELVDVSVVLLPACASCLILQKSACSCANKNREVLGPHEQLPPIVNLEAQEVFMDKCMVDSYMTGKYPDHERRTMECSVLYAAGTTEAGLTPGKAKAKSDLWLQIEDTFDISPKQIRTIVSRAALDLMDEAIHHEITKQIRRALGRVS